MILSDRTLRNISPLIVNPFHERTKFKGMTYGLGAAGYDVRIAQDVWVWKPLSLQLASTLEHFIMPNDVLAQVCDKSTWVRRGVYVHNTVIEPGWCGVLTLEIASNSWKPIKIEKGSPIAQIIFFQLDQETSQPYRGKYQHQPAGPQKAILEA